MATVIQHFGTVVSNAAKAQHEGDSSSLPEIIALHQEDHGIIFQNPGGEHGIIFQNDTEEGQHGIIFQNVDDQHAIIFQNNAHEHGIIFQTPGDGFFG